jgi:hypothetical protein
VCPKRGRNKRPRLEELEPSSTVESLLQGVSNGNLHVATALQIAEGVVKEWVYKGESIMFGHAEFPKIHATLLACGLHVSHRADADCAHGPQVLAQGEGGGVKGASESCKARIEDVVEIQRLRH